MALVGFLCSIIFQITPLKLLSLVSDFASHHYFLTGFITLVALLYLLKIYYSNQDEIKILKNEKNLLFKSKLQERKQCIQKFKNNIALKIFALKNKVNRAETPFMSRYSVQDVLQSPKDMLIRQRDLTYAMKLDNSFKQNVKLYYKESNLNKCIETAILFVNNEHVTIKGGLTLPIKSIYKVEI